MPYFGIQVLSQVYNHPAILSAAHRLSCRSIPALAESQPSNPRSQPMMVAGCNSLNCFYFALKQTLIQSAETEILVLPELKIMIFR